MIVLATATVCAVVYVGLAVAVSARGTGPAAGRALPTIACLATSVWAATTWWGSIGGAPDLVRMAGWYGLAWRLYAGAVGDRSRLRAFGWIGAVSFGAACLGILAAPDGVAARILLAVVQLLLLENLYRGVDADRRWHVGLFCIALASVALYDLAITAELVLAGEIGAGALAGRELVPVLVAPLLVLSALRNRSWRPAGAAKRSAAFHSVVLLASGVFLVSLAVAAEGVRRLGIAPSAEWGTLLEICVLFSAAVGLAVVLCSASSRNWLSRLVVSYFFVERYDYRSTWLACIDTLSDPGRDGDGLGTRSIRALADVVDSPAGVLLSGDPEASEFGWTASWNAPPTGPVGREEWLPQRLVQAGCVVLEPDALESGRFAGREFRLAVGLPGTGAAAPLAGIVLLAPSRGPFRIDREVTLLLGVVAREVATRLEAERATRSLMETRDLRAYGERFAFVAHDIKNVAGQLRLLTANARTHMENPAFRTDMLTTIEASVRKIGALIRRLETVESGGLPTGGVDPLPRIEAACRTTREGARVSPPEFGANAAALVRVPERDLDAVLGHVLDNACRAAGARGRVVLALGSLGGATTLDVTDDGTGMTPEFVRDSLFRPFRSASEGGSGIGAFQARQLLRRQGGDLVVLRSGPDGTTMRLMLPTAGRDTTALSA